MGNYYYQKSVEEVLKIFQTDLENGLSAEETRRRQSVAGYNVLPEVPTKSLFIIFLEQFKNPLIYILLCAAAIIFFLGHHGDAFLISGILLFNAVIGTFQEGRAKQILQQLKKMTTSSCVVVRDGVRTLVPEKELVPGDVIMVLAGQQVPADARLGESTDVYVNEALITGESAGVVKNTDTIDKRVPIFEQKNMLFKGTYVMNGTARAVVVATGSQTYVGSVHTAVSEEATSHFPLRQELDSLAHKIVIAILAFCVVLFGIGFAVGQTLQELLVTLTALFICVVPEGLPVVLTLVLVTGVYRMAKKKVLIKRLQAVEGLGRVSTIIVDKTGTLTRNQMMVEKVYTPTMSYTVSGSGYDTQGQVIPEGTVNDVSNKQLTLLATAAAFLDGSQVEFVEEEGRFIVKGEPTETALGLFAHKVGVHRHQLRKISKRFFEIPFSTHWQMHVAGMQTDHERWIFVAGIPEAVMQISGDTPAQARDALKAFLTEGLRVVAFAAYKIPEGVGDVVWEHYIRDVAAGQLQFLGLCAIQDSIRTDVAPMVEKVQQAGLRVVMATGDHCSTALYVAKKTGIAHDGSMCIEGKTLPQLSDQQILAAAVFARVTPHDKVALVEVERRAGNKVAMTGDGINDVACLVAADVSIAMGSGTDIAKEAADVVLLEDSFSTIVEGIEEGRHIFAALRRVILYFFATNFGEVLVVVGALLLRLPFPLEAAQILWLNLITDGFLDSALAAEPQEKDILQTQPLSRYHHGLIDTPLLLKVLWMSVPMALGSLYLFSLECRAVTATSCLHDTAHARTVLLVCLAMFQWFNAWNCRSEKKSILTSGFFTNWWLIAATVFVLLLQVAVVYVPFLQNIFKTVPLTLSEWLLASGVAFSIIILEEARKYMVRARTRQ